MTTDITLIPTGTWVVDPAHSRIGFAVRHLGISTVRGEFKDFEGRSMLPNRCRAGLDRGERHQGPSDKSEAAAQHHAGWIRLGEHGRGCRAQTGEQEDQDAAREQVLRVQQLHG